MDVLLDPNIAYLLLVTGFMLAVMAVLTPGTGVLEVGALFALLLTGWAVYQLPINYWALGLLILGVFPFLVAVRRSGEIVYLAISIAALVVGSAFLFRGESWLPAVNPVLAVVVSVVSGAFLWILATKTLEAAFARPVHDLERLIGAKGEARTEVHQEGSVYVSGEMWSAYSDQPIPSGKPVRVVGREGFILEVKPADDSPEHP